ncbi:MAG: toxin-antitoxin system TumE family protein [Chloroflexota bacterium]
MWAQVWPRVFGELFLQNGTRIVVRECLLFNRLPLVIDWYGYEIWRVNEKLYWYDSQPHPDESALQSTHPHHKHIPPDMKRNRIPAPNMRFDQPNIPWLLEEAGRL